MLESWKKLKIQDRSPDNKIGLKFQTRKPKSTSATTCCAANFRTRCDQMMKNVQYRISKLTKVAVCRRTGELNLLNVNVKCANTTASEFLGRFHARLLIKKLIWLWCECA